MRKEGKLERDERNHTSTGKIDSTSEIPKPMCIKRGGLGKKKKCIISSRFPKWAEIAEVPFHHPQ